MLENINLDYKGDLTERFMCIFAQQEFEDFREKMLENNDILGFLPLKCTHEDNRKLYMYRISDRKSLREYLLDNVVTAEYIAWLLGELEGILNRGKGYAFEQDDVILHPDTIYISNANEVSLCYMPGYFRPVRKQLSDFLGFLLDYIDINDQRTVFLIYKTFMLSKEDNCTMGSLIDSLKQPSSADEEPVRAEEVIDKPKGNADLGKKKEEKKAIKRIFGFGALIISLAVLVLCFILI